jgi:hypothetical protein
VSEPEELEAPDCRWGFAVGVGACIPSPPATGPFHDVSLEAVPLGDGAWIESTPDFPPVEDPVSLGLSLDASFWWFDPLNSGVDCDTVPSSFSSATSAFGFSVSVIRRPTESNSDEGRASVGRR